MATEEYAKNAVVIHKACIDHTFTARLFKELQANEKLPSFLVLRKKQQLVLRDCPPEFKAEWTLIQKRAANDLLNLLIIYHEDESKDCSSKVNALYQTLGDKIIKEPTLNEPKKKKLQKRLEAKESNVLDSIQTYVDISQRKFEKKIEKDLRSMPDVPMDTMEGTSKAPETDNEQPPKNPPAHFWGAKPDTGFENSYRKSCSPRGKQRQRPVSSISGERQRPKVGKRFLSRKRVLRHHRCKLYKKRNIVAISNKKEYLASRTRHLSCDMHMTNNIVNVSSHTLTSNEIKLLNRGLSFVPKPSKIYMERILSEFDQLVRKMRLRYELRNAKQAGSRLFKRKSRYQPNITTNATLEETLNIMRENISSLEYEQVRGVNLTHGERQALIRLKEDNSLVINKADKGSTIVVQNHEDYALAGFKHLSDAKVYKPLNVDITPEVCMKLNAFLKRLYDEGLINKEMMDFCTPPNGVRTSRIYFLLKVHKNPMGIRPIVSGIKYATEFLSQFVDIWLQPLMQSLPSYIRDTTHFIKMIEETPFPKDCLMASIDVSSLYTNIIHEDGIESAINALHSTYATNEDQPPPEVIGDMLRFILTHNVIEFEGKYFLQLQGCTMGSKCSPSYACIYMGDVEKHLLFLADNKILFWKRYIDDIFLIYSGSTGDFQNYMKVINEVYET